MLQHQVVLLAPGVAPVCGGKHVRRHPTSGKSEQQGGEVWYFLRPSNVCASGLFGQSRRKEAGRTVPGLGLWQAARLLC